jgi:hypothetical protein
VKRVLLKSVFIPNTSYNVNQYNNQFTYDQGGGDKTVTVPPGQYSATGFLDSLVAELAAEVPAVTLTYAINTTTNKITLTFANPTIIRGSSTSAYVIGLDPEVDTASLTVHPSPYVLDFSGLKKVYIGSHTMSKGTTMSSSDKNHIKIFTEIDIDQAYGKVVHRVLDNLDSIDEATHSIPFNVSSLDLTLYDEDLNPLDLNGHHVQLVLKCIMQI